MSGRITTQTVFGCQIHRLAQSLSFLLPLLLLLNQLLILQLLLLRGACHSRVGVPLIILRTTSVSVETRGSRSVQRTVRIGVHTRRDHSHGLHVVESLDLSLCLTRHLHLSWLHLPLRKGLGRRRIALLCGLLIVRIVHAGLTRRPLGSSGRRFLVESPHTHAQAHRHVGLGLLRGE